MRTRIARAHSAGFTLMEVVIAMTVMMIVIGAIVPFFRMQARQLDSSAGRQDALQSGQFALGMIDRDVRVAGVGVVVAQPLLIRGAGDAISFNADVVSRTPPTTGRVAVYYDSTADSASVTSLDKSRRMALANSTFYYPDTTYYSAGGTSALSGAETISYWVSRDSTSAAVDEYILWRQVNDAPRRVVAKGVVVAPGQTVFRYFVPVATGGDSALAPISLPVAHTAAMHGSLADSAGSRMSDSVRSVGVTLVTRYRDGRTGITVQDTLQTKIRMLNAGLAKRTVCGEPPIFIGPVTTTVVTLAGGKRGVKLTWPASVDDGGGQRDVYLYGIYRRLSTTAAFGEPFAGIPAGSPTYTFTDTDVASGTWVYGVDALDCTPARSPMAVSSAVTLP
ncbi:MAG: hypothetical protein NVS4B3_07070 [Gemmatimonadaceae bacterium]